MPNMRNRNSCWNRSISCCEATDRINAWSKHRSLPQALHDSCLGSLDWLTFAQFKAYHSIHFFDQ